MIVDYIIVVVLIAFSALFSGLTLGLMSLDVYDLERKARNGNKQAKKIYPLRARGNLLLTTLLLGNVFVNSVLAIFLGSVASGVIATIIATTLIFLFGEILPQAVISRYAIPFGALTTPFVRLAIFVFYPIVYPISKALDKMLGKEMPNIYSHNELISIISEHEDAKESPLDEDEERIMLGTLRFSQKKVGEVMTPRTVVVSVLENEKISPKFIHRLRNTGFSRFPVYETTAKERAIGILHLRSLLGITEGFVSDLKLLDVHVVNETASLDDVLNKFIETRVHLFLVNDEFGDFVGVVSLEDILEEIIQQEVVDENDRHANMRAFARSKFKKRGAV